MAVSVSNVEVLLSLRDGFERFASKTDEIGHVLEIELRHLLEEWDERVQKARAQERECENDLSEAQRDLRWCESKDDNEANSAYERERVEKAQRALVKAQAYFQLVSRGAREIQIACEGFQKHGRALRQMSTQTAPNASSYLNTLLRDRGEQHAYIPPASDVRHTSSGGFSASASLPEQTVNPKKEPPVPPPQIQLSSSMRGLAALLRGQPTPTWSRNTAHIEFAGQRLRAISELAPTMWETLPIHQRVAALHRVEYMMAELQARPAATLVVKSDTGDAYGGYDPQAEHIFLSHHFISDASAREVVEAVIHKGRHAYQTYAMKHPAFHPDLDEVGRWRINNLYYLHAHIWGDQTYRDQPVERDAFAYAEAVAQHLYGEETTND